MNASRGCAFSYVHFYNGFNNKNLDQTEHVDDPHLNSEFK